LDYASSAGATAEMVASRKQAKYAALSGSYMFQPIAPRAGSGVVRIDPLRFLAGCCTRRLNQALSVLSLSLGFFLSMRIVLLTVASIYVVLFLCSMRVLSLGCSC